jgi:hypothetical protein
MGASPLPASRWANCQLLVTGSTHMTRRCIPKIRQICIEAQFSCWVKCVRSSVAPHPYRRAVR